MQPNPSPAQPPSYLVCLFCTTAGQNSENLGSDEEQVALLVYLLYDVANNKVVNLLKHYVRPVADDISETILTEECKIQTGLNEDEIKNAQPLEQVLDELDRFLCQKEIHPEHGGKPFFFLTDGPLHLRLCMHPEAIRKNMHLPGHYHRYFDIRKEFKRFYKVQVVNCIKDMLDFLGLEQVDQGVEYGIRQCQEMASIIQRLINDGHVFKEPEPIKEKLEPGICSRTDVVDDESVVRARGLPWQSSDQDIARFFKGLNVAKGGVALCLSQQGRRNGEALVRFETKEHRDLALRKHKHHLGQRYIEVYRASGKDFVSVAGGNNKDAQAFLSRHGDNGIQVIVRMRGLPYSCTAEQVMEFFHSKEGPVEVLEGEEGILFVHQADGRATGDAFVLFATEEDATRALSKHRQSIGTRYIELFKSTTAEVQQVLNRSMDPRTPSAAEVPEPQFQALLPQVPQSPLPGMLLPQQIITSGTQRDCIRLRGLPFESTVTDILAFLGEHSRNIIFQGVHMVYNAQGTPSGEAFIQMDSELSADGTTGKHKKFMIMGNKKRYIEVIQCSGEDMNMVLTNGLAGASQQLTPQGLMPAHHPHLPPGVTLQRPILSPGAGTTAVMPGHPHMAMPVATTPTAALTPGGALAAYPGAAQLTNGAQQALYSAYTQQSLTMGPLGMQAAQQTQAAIMAGQPQMAALAGLPAGLPAGMQTVLQANGVPGLTQLPQRPGNGYMPGPGYQPLYWYPSPPVSPQSAYYMTASPSTVVVKGLPFNAQPHDIMAFFEGIYEVTPDIQMQRGPDGRFTGEAYITFGSRTEAERAITERNRKVMHNRYIELHMA